MAITVGLPSVAEAKAADPIPATASWLQTLNAHRVASGVAPVTANPAWTPSLVAHARYTTRNARSGHDEDPKLPLFTPEGRVAARSADLLNRSVRLSERDVLEILFASPFHAIGLLRPGLKQSAYGAFLDPTARAEFRFAAGIDILRGLQPVPAPTTPVLWPGRGAVVRSTRYPGNEFPDPVAGCRGFDPKSTGLPIVALLPEAPTRVSATLSGIGLCILTGDSYRNPDATAQASVRALLRGANAVVLLPAKPLAAGAAYAVRLTTAARAIAWSFQTVG